MARTILRDHGEPVLELRVTAMHLENRSGQIELFTPDEVSTLRPASTIDPVDAPDDEILPVV
jgi:hypothetical protein